VPNGTVRVTNRLILRDFHNHESRSNGVNFPTFQIVDCACLRKVIHWKPLLLAGFGKHPYIGDLVSEGIDLAIRFGQPRRSTLVSRKVIEAPIEVATGGPLIFSDPKSRMIQSDCAGVVGAAIAPTDRRRSQKGIRTKTQLQENDLRRECA
jgi:hypothetical protein